jgi:aryl-alcohol dehydrogenase-like predicted oxidoreductase
LPQKQARRFLPVDKKFRFVNISRRSFLKSVAGAATGIPLVGLPKSRAAEPNSIPKRKFGRHDEMLSVLGVGGLTLGGAESIDEALRIAHRAIDLGVNFFENAWDYRGGKAEEWMGHALEGKRDQIFLMTKVCTHNKAFPDGGKEGAMRMLEESLRRLKTDHIDLWMIHAIESMEEVEKAYMPGGVLEAFEKAKKEGKIRYTGFTGHTDPEAHLKLLEGGYAFDATLMPVSALGALSSRQFEKVVMPELVKRNIACLGMKGFGGSKRAHLHGLVTAETVMRYSLSYPQVCTHVIGIDKMPFLDQAALAASKTPMTPAERDAFTVSLSQQGGERFAVYLEEGHKDGCCGTAA